MFKIGDYVILKTRDRSILESIIDKDFFNNRVSIDNELRVIRSFKKPKKIIRISKRENYNILEFDPDEETDPVGAENYNENYFKLYKEIDKLEIE